MEPSLLHNQHNNHSRINTLPTSLQINTPPKKDNFLAVLTLNKNNNHTIATKTALHTEQTHNKAPNANDAVKWDITQKFVGLLRRLRNRPGYVTIAANRAI